MVTFSDIMIRDNTIVQALLFAHWINPDICAHLQTNEFEETRRNDYDV